MKQKGFAPILIILLIAILGVVGYFAYKNHTSSQLTNNNIAQETVSPTATPVVNAAIFASKDGSPWQVYKNYTYKFTVRFPNQWNAFLQDPLWLDTYPCEGCGGKGPGLAFEYLDNSQLVSFENLILSKFKSDKWTQDNALGKNDKNGVYEKYVSPGNNLNIYIDRLARTAGSQAQDAFIDSPDNKFVLNMFCSECDTQTMNKVLSSISFDLK